MVDIIQMYEANARIDDETARALAAEAALSAAIGGKASTATVAALDTRVGAAETALTAAQAEDIALAESIADVNQQRIDAVATIDDRLEAIEPVLANIEEQFPIQMAAVNGRVDDVETALAGKADEAETAAIYSRQIERPELSRAFSSTLTGTTRAPITNGDAAINDALGAVWRLNGGDAVGGYQDIAPISETALEADRTYEARAVLQRNADPVDPSGHSIELRMQNLDKNRASVSNVLLETVPSTVAAGVQEAIVTFSLAPGADYQNPATTRYALPFLRLYGGDHQTDIAVLYVRDITDRVVADAALAAAMDTEEAARILGDTAELNRALSAEALLDNSIAGAVTGLSGIINALAEYTDAVDDAAQGARLTVGELPLDFCIGQQFGDAVPIVGPAGGANYVGFTSPAGAAVAPTFVTARQVFTAEERAELTGYTLRLRATALVTDGFLDDRTLDTDAVYVNVVGGGQRLSQGTVLPFELDASGLYLTREAIYTMVGDETHLGIVFQIASGSGTANNHQLEVIGITRTIETVPANLTTTPADAMVAAKVVEQLGGVRFKQIVPPHSIETDANGFGLAAHRGGTSFFGPLIVKRSVRPGFFDTDVNGYGPTGVLAAPPEDDPVAEAPILEPMFAPVLVGAAGVPVQIYLDGLLQRRADRSMVDVTLASNVTDVVASGDPITVIPGDLGATATLALCETADRSTVCHMPLSVISAPSPATFTAPFTVLMLGDSILNRGGAFLTKGYLDGWGYDPTFIGTLVGTNSPTTSSPENGVAGEGREGWSLANWAYADLTTSTVAPLAPGDEAAYLAMTKAQRLGIHPAVRAATGGDDPSIIRNGYVLDFAFYQSRFGFATPNVVTIGLGTNDTSDYGPDLVGPNTLDNMTLLLTRLKAAWPSVKINIYCPGTGRDGGVRDERWDARYIPMLRAMFDARVAAGSTGITIAPTWCMATGEAGYVLASGETDPWTGAVTASYADAVHPRGATCRQLYRSLAPYIAAAAAGLI